MATNNQIKFYRGLKSKYTYVAGGNLEDVIFFATDTGELIVNGTNYGTDTEKIKDAVHDVENHQLKLTKYDNTVVTLDVLSTDDRTALDNLKTLLEGAGFTPNYETTLDDNLATVSALGGIPAGTKVSKYKNQPISKVIDDLLFPTVQPTITAPSASLSLKNYTALQEFGATAPTSANFTASWNQGSIKIGSTEQAKRAGSKISDKLYAGSETSELPTKVALGDTNYYYKVYYAEGPQPLDSKGNNATTGKLAAGSVTSSAVKVTGVYPFYANVTNGTLSKLPLTSATSFTAKLGAEGPDKHIFLIPYTITKIEMLNTLSNQYEVYGLENFTKTTGTNINVNGTLVPYNTYTRNDAGFNGETTYKITYSK